MHFFLSFRFPNSFDSLSGRPLSGPTKDISVPIVYDRNVTHNSDLLEVK